MSATKQFQKFCKKSKGNDVGSLLQFLTGSNIIICDTVTVTFTNVDSTTQYWCVRGVGGGGLLIYSLSYHAINLPILFQLAEEFMVLLNDKES